ncbi:hypothetical protein C900_05315 [Fulvivirga imtechensis AK7]|uniref:Uncharacterized protein n=1 Tax=Fulvivirga imtechensis AK7 TaxID=1237149 RepID=L8JP36_9BACT|nr:hypothetical protein [Fulvivirga imtechensis]ELR69244.1 hypothetical protein C900_05315 [Fulvivirga imtechensis AK7]
MKTALLSLMMLLWIQLAQANKYEKVMLEAIESLYQADSISQYQEVINKFDRIAAREADKWEPLYYAGFGYVMMANKSQQASIKDQYLDLAMRKVNKALDLAPGESELMALEGFIHMIRVTVDPAVRGQQYAPLSMQAFGKAIAHNPDNPRALYLMGQMEYGTAQFFGADTSEACGKLKSAVEKFSTYISDNPLAPTWGKKGAESSAERCGK